MRQPWLKRLSKPLYLVSMREFYYEHAFLAPVLLFTLLNNGLILKIRTHYFRTYSFVQRIVIYIIAGVKSFMFMSMQKAMPGKA